MQAPAPKAKGGKGGGKLKRKLSVLADPEGDESLSTPPAAVREDPGSDPCQKKSRGPRGKGKAKAGKGRGLSASTGKGSGAEESEKKGEQHGDNKPEESIDKGEQHEDDKPEESADKGEQQHDKDKPEESADKGEQHDDKDKPEESADKGEPREAAVAANPNPRRRGHARVPTPGQEAARIKSQAVADRNLAVVRSLAGKHPELQPQVGFAGKRLG